MERTRQLDLRKFSVQPKPCRSCPFEGEEPLQLLPKDYAKYIENLNGKGQHLCHSANNRAISRGGRNIQLKILYARGVLSSPTDEAFNQAVDEAMKTQNVI